MADEVCVVLSESTARELLSALQRSLLPPPTSGSDLDDLGNPIRLPLWNIPSRHGSPRRWREVDADPNFEVAFPFDHALD